MKPILLSYHIGKAFLDNPFTEAIKNSKITGKYLAELLIRNFRDNFINLVAFSLGCDLLNSIMTHLI